MISSRLSSFTACTSILALLALGLAGSAAAAPVLDVSVSHTPTTTQRNDERLDYTLKVKNVASANPAPGDTLTCDANQAKWFNQGVGGGLGLVFAFEWIGNGVAASGPTTQPTNSTSTYVVQAADAGHSLQCKVLGTGDGGAAASFSNPIVVAPLPSPPAPSFASSSARPTITPTGNNALERTCVPPTGWSGSPTWSFRWLRSGVPIPGATSAAYLPGAEDAFKVLQCEVTGTNADGAAVAISNNTATSPPPEFPGGTPPNNNGENRPSIPLANATSGPVTLEFILPAGADLSIFGLSAAGWACSVQPAAGSDGEKVVCQRETALEPGQEAPAISVAVAAGPLSPDAFTVNAKASGGGAAGVAVAEDAFEFGAFTPFGISAFSTKVADALGDDLTQAGGHPVSGSASLEIPTRRNRQGNEVGIEEVRSIITDLPPGFIGNPEAIPQNCSSMAEVVEDTFDDRTCPPSSIVGSVNLKSVITGTGDYNGVALYSIEPERGTPAQFAFVITKAGFQTPISLTPRLRPEDGYAITVDAPLIAKEVVPQEIEVKLCGYGAETTLGSFEWEGAPDVVRCLAPGDPGANEVPLLTNPTECADPAPVTDVAVDSWSKPGEFKTATAVAPQVTGCEKAPFGPTAVFRPTSSEADSPTGLDVSISLPPEGLESSTGLSQAHLKRAVVTLPKGMAVNPAAANGLGACTQAQLGMRNGVPDGEPVRCPDSSKIGSAEVVSPLLDEKLEGAVYLARQGDNPFKSLLAMYLVVESKERGILVKIPGRVTPGADGQLVTTFDDNPQVPFSSLKLHFNSGNRAPLLNPPKCGTYEIVSQLTPWSAADPDNPTPAETRTATSTFEVSSGPGGGPCPSGDLAPKLAAGLTNPVAATASPFVLELSRDDGSQRFSGLDIELPPGLTAHLRGVPYCADATLAAISGAEGAGAAELAAPSCPASSQIGTVSVGAGGGSNPFYVNTGRAYLAGPYKGAPLSVAIVTPAVAGPFDLGNVVVRSAILVDPKTAQISVKSDPIPTILHGIPVDVRDIRVNIDRPSFTLAPTSCEAASVGARVSGEHGAAADVSNRFQISGCAELGFKPRLSLRLFGGTERADYQGLRAVVRPRPGDANIGRTVVRMPRSAFLAQEHIRTVCTRVQFAADACPPGAVYGKAIAYSPLLDHPLQGKVYLRSSDNTLPDLVADLRGPAEQPIRIELVGRTDSVKGALRNTFDVVPDAPVSYFRLQLFGGKKGLIVNSRDICRRKNRAAVRLDAQSGDRHDLRPVVRNSRCGKGKGKSKTP